MKKRILSTLLALCMVLTLLPAEALAAEWDNATQSEMDSENEFLPRETAASPAVDADEIIANASEVDSQASGTCGDNVTWTLADDGTLTISGSGNMENYYVASADHLAPWSPLAESIKKVIVEDGITSIGNGAFSRCSNLTDVSIPDTVTRIGGYAFEISGLQSVEIPSGVTVIEEGTFLLCSALQSVSLPNTLTSIDFDAFSSCRKLTDIIIPEGVVEIGGRAFYACEGLVNVAIPNSVISIGNSAFADCFSLINVSIPNSVTSIGGGAFSSCNSLENVSIPSSVNSIGGSAFSYCDSLTNVSIPNGVTSIGAGAFYQCDNLSCVLIARSVTNIGEGAFSGCQHLRAISVDEDNESYCSVDGILFDRNKTHLLGYPSGKSDTTYLIPESVTHIGDRAFDGCDNLANVTIPESVTSIGDLAFTDCNGLASVEIPNGVTSIEASTFKGCKNLISITIPESVASIGTNAFYGCISLTNVSIPESVASIGASAFYGCISLTNVSIPKSVVDIGDSAFWGCSGLTNVTIPEGVVDIGNRAFWGCSSLTSATIPGHVASISDYMFGFCSNLAEVTISEGVTEIGYGAFEHCSSLNGVTIPKSITTINRWAFYGAGPNFIIYCYPNSYAQEYAEYNKINYELLGISGRTLSISLFDETGMEVAEGFTVTWYDDSGNEVGTTPVLSGADTGKIYSFEIRLGAGLSALYEQPERQTITPSDLAQREVQLVKKIAVRMLILSGKVCTQEGNPLSGATVTLVSASTDPIEAATGMDGSFHAEIPCEIVSVTIRMDGYYSKRETLNLTNNSGNTYDTGVYVLDPVQVITDRLTLSISQRQASEDPGTAIELPLVSLGAMKITLTGSNGRSITDFEAQGLALMLRPGTVSAGETITVTVDDPSGTYKSASASITLDDNRLGSTELNMIQKGGFVFGGLSGPEANLLLFDRTGNCIQTSAAVSGLTIKAMNSGTYDVVLVKKSELLRSVPHMNYLGNLGLREGQDYLLRQITITDGKIVRLDGCAVPFLDESRISYTIAENTNVTTNKPGSIAIGELLLVRAAYELDASKGVTANDLKITLPDGIELVDYSVLVNNETAAYTYDAAKREVSIRMNGRDKAVVRLYCTPETSGNYSIGAFLQLSNGACQPIGAAIVQVEDARLEVPERTGKSSGLVASGRTSPGSKVTLYDNDVEVGHATANAAGSWSISFNLVQPIYSYSYHTVYAEITDSYLKDPIITESVLVTYDKRLDVELTKITMYNTDDSHRQKTTVFDFAATGLTTTPYYRIYPGRYPTFTFKAEFSGDASKLSEVYVVTTNDAGDETYVRTTYDPASNAWLGTHNYASFNTAPVTITATYGFENMSEIPFDGEQHTAMVNSYDEIGAQIATMLNPLLDERFDIISLAISDNRVTGKINYKDQDILGSVVSFWMEISQFDGTVTAGTLTQSGYTRLSEQSQIWYKQELHSNSEAGQTFYDLDNGICITMDISLDSSASSRKMVHLLRVSDTERNLYNVLNCVTEIATGVAIVGVGAVAIAAFAPAAALATLGTVFTTAAVVGIGAYVASTAGDVIENVWDLSILGRDWMVQVNGHSERLMEYWEEANNLLYKTCPQDGSLRLSRADFKTLSQQAMQISDNISIYNQEALEKINEAKDWISMLSAFSCMWSALNEAKGTLEKADELLKVSDLLKDFGFDAATDKISGDAKERKVAETNNYIQDQAEQLFADITELALSIREKYQNCDHDDGGDLFDAGMRPSAHPVTYIADPSGYVYEAVPSNRLSGVTAVISSESSGIWNATDYDQLNPQTTGADGGFYWDVPRGNWKVSFTKRGYQTTDTSGVRASVNGWLPVPPPQLDINVGMISTIAPMVEKAVAYTDRVEVEFSQYMDISSVQNALVLACDGAAVSNLVVEPLNAEYNPENTKQYATRFAAVFTDVNLSGNFVVSVANSAVNYAGKSLSSAYTSELLTTSVRPDGIVVQEMVSVGLHKKANVEVTLQPGITSQRLVIENLSPSLIGVPEAVMTADGGAAAVSVTGNLPGIGLLQITEPVSGLSTTVIVNVSLDGGGEDAIVAPVKASLGDGTVVKDGMKIPYGEKITLRTDTNGAVIRYTLDDTCPCESTALTYSGSITFTENMVLRAVAYKDGVYGRTMRLNLSVESTGGEIDPPSKVCQVVFDSQGGSAVSSISVSSGDKIAKPADPTRSGYNFGGWYKESNCTNAWNFSADTVTSNITLYAKWTYKAGNGNWSSGEGGGSGSNYTISVPSHITGGTVKVNPIKAEKGDTVTIAATPNSGYELDKLTVTDGKGNELSLTGKGNGEYTFVMPASKVTVSASFVAITPTNPIPQISFTDVRAGAYYYNAVAWAVEQGITAGTSATTFSPDSPCTRAQIVTFLWRAAGSPVIGVSNPFTDVASGSYYYDAVAWAVANGITAGTSATTFSPNDTCTRGQAVTFLYRAAGSPAASGGNAFTDVASGAYYTNAVQWAVNKGVTAGTSTTTFSPNDSCTRAQIVTFLYRDRVN